MTRKEETWCSTAGGRRHQTWAQTREKRTAAAGIWQLAALAAGREETPLPVSLGRWRLMHTHTFTNLAALFPVFPARDSRSRSPQPAGWPATHYYYYRYRYMPHAQCSCLHSCVRSAGVGWRMGVGGGLKALFLGGRRLSFPPTTTPHPILLARPFL